MSSSDLQRGRVLPAPPGVFGGAGGVAGSLATVCSAGCQEPTCAAEEISAGSGDLQSVYLVPRAPRQCFSLEEDDLNLMSLDAETILEAEEILGTMQNYLDSSVISIIEDLSLSEVGAHVRVREAAAGLALAVAWVGVAAASPMSGSHGCAPLLPETTPALAAEQGLPGCTERAVPADCHH